MVFILNATHLFIKRPAIRFSSVITIYVIRFQLVLFKEVITKLQLEAGKFDSKQENFTSKQENFNSMQENFNSKQKNFNLKQEKFN